MNAAELADEAATDEESVVLVSKYQLGHRGLHGVCAVTYVRVRQRERDESQEDNTKDYSSMSCALALARFGE